MKDPVAEFFKERREDIRRMAGDKDLHEKSIDWMLHADRYKYTYNFTWLGRPIIKFPSDMIALQEIIWSVNPDLVIETGIAHGGSLVFSASMLELLGGEGKVLGIDIEIREHNKKEIDKHPLRRRIDMIEGNSVDQSLFNQVRGFAEGKKRVLVILDSLHSHEHVLQEMSLYSELVTVGSYLVLPDTFIEYFPKDYYPQKGRPWDVGNNPMTAMREFLEKNDNFIVDKEIVDKLVITEGFDGYLKRIK